MVEPVLAQTNLLGAGFPSFTYETALAQLSNPQSPNGNMAPAAAAAQAIDTSKMLTDLGKAAAVSAFTGNPASVITAGIGALVDVFAMLYGTGSAAPSPLAQFQADVDTRLTGISVQLDQVQATLQQVVSLDTEIKMAIDDTEFNQVLTQMISSATVIDNAFMQFGNYANVITDPNTDPNTHQDATARMYELLTTNPTYGPDKVLEALTNYQRYALGFGGSRGILSFIPQMVQNAWEECSMNPVGSANDYSDYLNDGQGPFHDSIAFISSQCLQFVYTNMADNMGRTVQGVFGTILTEQLKGYAMLSAAYGNSTLDAPYLQTVAAGAQAVGSAMNNLWATITVPATVDATAQKLLTLHTETLGAGRGNQYWHNALDINDHPYNGMPSYMQTSFITTACPAQRLDPGSPDSFAACVVDPKYIDLSNSNGNVGVPVTTLTYGGQGYAPTKSTQVLAPICYCPGEDVCIDATAKEACLEDFGSAAKFLGYYDAYDKNGNKCWTGTVPMCGIPDNTRVQYLYNAWDRASFPAPHSNLPPMPSFLQGIQAAFSQ